MPVFPGPASPVLTVYTRAKDTHKSAGAYCGIMKSAAMQDAAVQAL